MAAFNKVILIGNLCADPELKQTPSGVSVTNFNLAVSRRFQKEGEKQTDFIQVVAWRNTAEFICKYFGKGKPILVVGSLQSRSWTDSNGQKRYTTEVVAEEAQFVSIKSDSEPNVTPAPYGTSPSDVDFEEMTADDDLPF